MNDTPQGDGNYNLLKLYDFLFLNNKNERYSARRRKLMNIPYYLYYLIHKNERYSARRRKLNVFIKF